MRNPVGSWYRLYGVLAGCIMVSCRKPCVLNRRAKHVAGVISIQELLRT